VVERRRACPGALSGVGPEGAQCRREGLSAPLGHAALVAHHLRQSSRPRGHDRDTGGHGFQSAQAEGLRAARGREQHRGAGHQLAQLSPGHGAEQVDIRSRGQTAQALAQRPVARHLERHAGGDGGLHGDVGTLFV